MALTLYLHPLASFCHKVLLALYENDIPFTAQIVDLGDPGSAAPLLEQWPVGKIPVLHDSAAGRTLPESSIIIEYLQQHYPGPLRLLPDEPEPALEVRLWDRFFDLYVSVPMQKMVIDRIRPEGSADSYGVAEARATLDVAYGMIETRMCNRDWAAGDLFTMADCAALPALFFATIVHPPSDQHGAVSDYLQRLLDRPAAHRVLAEAKPYFAMFPYRDAMPSPYLDAP